MGRGIFLSLFGMCIFSAVGAASPDGENPYEILGVHKHACIVEIERAFQTAVKRLHAQKDLDPEALIARRAALIEAWEMVSIPRSRVRFDAENAAAVREERVEEMLELMRSEDPAAHRRLAKSADELFSNIQYQLTALESMNGLFVGEGDFTMEQREDRLYMLGEWLERKRPSHPKFLARVLEIIEGADDDAPLLRYFTAFLEGQETQPLVFTAMTKWMEGDSNAGRLAFQIFAEREVTHGPSLVALSKMLLKSEVAAARAGDILLNGSFLQCTDREQDEIAKALWQVVSTRMKPPFEETSHAPQLLSRVRVSDALQREMIKDLEEEEPARTKQTVLALTWIGANLTPSSAYRLVEALRDENARGPAQELLSMWEDNFPDTLKPFAPQMRRELLVISNEKNPDAARAASGILKTVSDLDP